MEQITLKQEDDSWTWSFRTPDTSIDQDWDWSFGSPDPTTIRPVRTPNSGDRSSHLPVVAFSQTIGRYLFLESSLELEAMQWWDRDADTTWIVAQPLAWRLHGKIAHIPDLLVVNDSSITVVDVRAEDKCDPHFLSNAEASRNACDAVGWNYELYTGSSETSQLNLKYASCARRTPEQLGAVKPQIEVLLERESSIEEVFSHDNGSGQLKGAFWHLVWTGEISINFEERWTGATRVQWAGKSE